MQHLNFFKKRGGYLALLLAMFTFFCGGLHAADISHNISTGNLTISGSSADNYIITGTTTTYFVKIQSGYKGRVTLKDLSIKFLSTSTSTCPFLVEGQYNCSNYNPVTIVDIVLEGDNEIVFYGSGPAALQVNQGAQINISAIDPSNNTSGKLFARATPDNPGTPGSYPGGGAAIGAPNSSTAQGISNIYNANGSLYSSNQATAGGNIIINSGIITAWGGHGAGIGGGYQTWYNGIIIVTGGVIEARAGRHAAGLGSGCPTGLGVLPQYADKSATIALPPCEITAYGASVGNQDPNLGLAGTKYLTYVNDPAKPIVTIRTEDHEKNANIYLDLTETPGLQNIFDEVYPTFDLTHVWIGKTAVTNGLMNVHGLFQNTTTFFTDASSSAPATLGRPYMPVSTTTSAAATIILPLFEANISFTDYVSVALKEGYSSAQAENNAYCLKLEYKDDFPLTQLTYKLQQEAASNFKNLIFLASDSATVISAPTTFNKGDVYYIIAPLKDGKPVGSYTDVILIKGTFKDVVMAGYIRRISDQIVVKDDTETNNHIKVTADPATFAENYPTGKTVNLTLNITHAGVSGVPYNPTDVTAKYLITTEQNYEDALAATPLSQWTNLAIPSSDGANAVTTASFTGKAADIYYIHWYVVSSTIMAHSKDVTDPARNYGGFGKYSIIAGKTVTYNSNYATAGNVPTDAAKYFPADSVTVIGNTGALTKTDATFIGWSFAASGIITTAAEEPADLLTAGEKFEIVADTTLYAVWAKDENGPDGDGDDVPDYLQFTVAYEGNGSTGGTPPTDANIYDSGYNVTAKAHGDLVKSGSTLIVFAGWTPSPVSGVLTYATAGDTTTAFVREGATFAIAGNTTLYAVWSTDVNGNGTPDIFETGYHVTYYANGATTGTPPTDATDYLTGMIATAKAKGSLAKDNAIFLGWSISAVSVLKSVAEETSAGIIHVDSNLVITSNLALYAVWADDYNGPGGGSDDEPDYNQFGVTYNGNGNNSGTAPTDAYIYSSGSIVTAKTHGTLARTDGIFAGWTPSPVSGVLTYATAADTTTAFVREGATFTIAGNTTLYAVWSTDVNGNGTPDIFETGYHVTYSGNGATTGTAPTDATDYLTGMIATAKAKGSLAKDNAAFLGWSVSALGVITTASQEASSGIIRVDSSLVITASLTLYAVWATDANGPGGGSDGDPDYNQFGVAYNGNGNNSGTAPTDANIYSSGGSVTAKTHGTLARTDGIFAGWTPSPVSSILTYATAADTTTAFVREGGTFTITGNTTLYAVWSTDVNENGTPDIFENGYHVTYSGNGATTGTAPTDATTYLTGMTTTLKVKGDIAKTNATFIGWNPSATGLITTLAAEDALTSMKQPGEIFTVTGNITWYAVWAEDTDSNDIPDYNQANITYNRGTLPALVTVTGVSFPHIKAVKKGTVTVTNLGIGANGYTLIGWHTVSRPIANSLSAENAIKAISKFYNIGDTIIISSDRVLYAVWAIDVNNNGVADYKDALSGQTQSSTVTRSGILAQEGGGISLRSGEVPGYWNDDFDKPAFDDAIYFTGCIFNADYDNELREDRIILNPVYSFGAAKADPDSVMDFIIEYGGVLAENSLIGGIEQKPLSRIEITPDMVNYGFTVDSLINYYPLSFTSAREDGQAVLKMYFIEKSTNKHPDKNDFISFGSWDKPFKDPETGKETDTLVIKFNIYNKPVFESEVISQYIDARGNIRLNHVSGTPVKYMMRSINGRNWEPASSPLTNMEQLAVNDGVSICLREMDEVIGSQNSKRAFYQSDDFNQYNTTGYSSVVDQRLTYRYSDSIYIESIAGVYDGDYNLYYGIYHTMFLASASPDVAHSEAHVWAVFEVCSIYSISYDPWTYANIHMDEEFKIYGQELASKTSIPDPCREVINLKFNTNRPPILQRYVEIHTIPGVTANPAAEEKHYVNANDDFTFTLNFAGSEPLKVTATGFYSQKPEELKGTELGGGIYRYVLRQLAEPWTVTVSTDPASTPNGEAFVGSGISVWTYANTLYINSDKAAGASIYTLSGTLLKQQDVKEGQTGIQLDRGIYVVEIDGSRYKVVVK